MSEENKDTTVNPWPHIHDKRVIRSFQGNIHGAIELLNDAIVKGFDKLDGILDKYPDHPVVDDIEDALMDLQSIDRSGQRLNNVYNSISDWVQFLENSEEGASDEVKDWIAEVAHRFVMPEEHDLLEDLTGYRDKEKGGNRE